MEVGVNLNHEADAPTSMLVRDDGDDCDDDDVIEENRRTYSHTPTVDAVPGRMVIKRLNCTCSQVENESQRRNLHAAATGTAKPDENVIYSPIYFLSKLENDNNKIPVPCPCGWTRVLCGKCVRWRRVAEGEQAGMFLLMLHAGGFAKEAQT